MGFFLLYGSDIVALPMFARLELKPRMIAIVRSHAFSNIGR